ncbi:unnamed protein product [Closterium sp. NIES-64]|nr:unnamed protein product [Closterium sp. NIES-64]
MDMSQPHLESLLAHGTASCLPAQFFRGGGGGLQAYGYLSQILSFHFGLPVVAVDASHHHTRVLHTRAARASKACGKEGRQGKRGKGKKEGKEGEWRKGGEATGSSEKEKEEEKGLAEPAVGAGAVAGGGSWPCASEPGSEAGTGLVLNPRLVTRTITLGSAAATIGALLRGGGERMGEEACVEEGKGAEGNGGKGKEEDEEEREDRSGEREASKARSREESDADADEVSGMVGNPLRSNCMESNGMKNDGMERGSTEEHGDSCSCSVRGMLAGLHACGDLTVSALRAFVLQPEVRAMAMVGCCYNLLSEQGEAVGVGGGEGKHASSLPAPATPADSYPHPLPAAAHPPLVQPLQSRDSDPFSTRLAPAHAAADDASPPPALTSPAPAPPAVVLPPFGFPCSSYVRAFPTSIEHTASDPHTCQPLIGRNGRDLACQSADRWRVTPPEEAEGNFEVHAFRAALEVLIVRHRADKEKVPGKVDGEETGSLGGSEEGLEGGGGGSEEGGASGIRHHLEAFSSYALSACLKLRISPPPSPALIASVWGEVSPYAPLVRAFWCLRAVLAGPLESLLVADRLLWLQEMGGRLMVQGKGSEVEEHDVEKHAREEGQEEERAGEQLNHQVKVQVKQQVGGSESRGFRYGVVALFQPEMSPRNLAIVALKEHQGL